MTLRERFEQLCSETPPGTVIVVPSGKGFNILAIGVEGNFTIAPTREDPCPEYEAAPI